MSKKITLPQQLNIIEGLCVLYYNNTNMTYKKFVNEVYKISHLNGTCENEHPEWHEDAYELGQSLDKKGICSLNKKRKNPKQEPLPYTGFWYSFLMLIGLPVFIPILAVIGAVSKVIEGIVFVFKVFMLKINERK